MFNPNNIQFFIMVRFKICFIVEPTDYLFPLQFGWFYRDTSLVTAPRIVGWTVGKTMMHGIVVDIKQYVFEVSLVVNWFAFKWSLKQWSMPVISDIKCFCIGVKQVREILMQRFNCFIFLTWQVWRRRGWKWIKYIHLAFYLYQ